MVVLVLFVVLVAAFVLLVLLKLLVRLVDDDGADDEDVVKIEGRGAMYGLLDTPSAQVWQQYQSHDA